MLLKQNSGVKKTNVSAKNKTKKGITIFLCVNMTGQEKLKMLIIDKIKSHWCFKRVTVIEVDCDFNKKSWKATDIFDKWLKWLTSK